MTAITVKFIAENPKVLTELKVPYLENFVVKKKLRSLNSYYLYMRCLSFKYVKQNEHETILKNRADKQCGFTWKEYRFMMSFTHMVINESLRLRSLSPATFRKAVTDVEINGYTIPAGWIILVVPSLLHYDPKIYEQPCEFNPWRWEGKELLSGSMTFIAFAGGARLCAGAEFARLQIAIFLHHLVTIFDFSLVESPAIIRTPLFQFSKPIRISISKNSLRSSHNNSSRF